MEVFLEYRRVHDFEVEGIVQVFVTKYVDFLGELGGCFKCDVTDSK